MGRPSLKRSSTSVQLAFARQQPWEDQLRQTEAALALHGAPEKFPLARLQRITDAFIRSSPSAASSVLRRRSIAPKTPECDALLGEQLARLRGELCMHETAILACLHVLTGHHARAQLCALRLDGKVTDEFFDRRLSVYLQTIVLSRKASREACSEAEVAAAEDLLAIVKDRLGGFPSVLGLLRAIGDGSCDALLPAGLIGVALKRSHYRVNLSKELWELQQEQRWFDAYKLVSGLRDIVGLPKADAVLRDVFPEYTMWACWRPDTIRITAWESPLLLPFRERIGPILDLEGPDTTGQQLGTLRMSSPGAFTSLATPGFSNDRHLLDRMLDDLDACLGIGNHALGLFVYVCVDMAGVSYRSLELIESALELRDNDAMKILKEFLVSRGAQSTIYTQVQSLTAALPVLQRSARLQVIYGINDDLALRGPSVLVAAQKHICMMMLTSDEDCERFGMQVLALGHALRNATWLHERWQPGYVQMLLKLPSQEEIRRSFLTLVTSRGATRESHVDYLTARLGPGRRRSRASWTASDYSSMASEDPIWSAVLDSDREHLRRILQGMRSVDIRVTTACVHQSIEESGAFVQELVDAIAGDTDQVCVNLASLLGPRTISPGHKVHECWRELLLEMMRSRPPGMLERCDEFLREQSWISWIENMRRIFGEMHLGEEGQCGFSKTRIGMITQRKLGMVRNLSTSTYSTDSTGQASMGLPSPSTW